MLLMGILLAACGLIPPPTPTPVASDQSFRVTSVSSRRYQEAEVGEWRYDSLYIDFANIDKYGLTENRVLADLKRVMTDSLIPASRQGTREVRAEFILTDLYHRENSEHFPTYIGGDLNFYDAQTGVRVASATFFAKPKFDKSSVNVVQEYNTLLRLTKEALPKFLPQP